MNPKFNSHIAYIIFSENNRLTFFNHYNNEHIHHGNIISQILHFPKDVAEVYCSKENLINMRMTGIVDGYNIEFIHNINDINKILIKTKFIIVSNFKEIEAIYQNITNIPFVLLSNILKTDEQINLYNFCDLNIEKFQLLFENMLKKQDNNMQAYCSELKEYTFSRNNSELMINTDMSIERNVYTLSNLNTIKSIRAKVKKTINQSFSNKNIELSINLINKIKSEIFINLKTNEIEEANYFYDYIISDLSNNFDFQMNNKNYTKHTLKNNGFEDFEIIFDALKFIKTFDFKDNKYNYENEYISQYLSEKEYLEELISIISASYLTPNIKLSIKENKYISILKEIGDIDRSEDNYKIHKAFFKLENQFHTDLTDWFDYMDCEASKKLKLVSNLPLEWITHCELPLMIKNDVSRIPISPGYLTEKLLLDTEQIHLSCEAFQKILFISSFQDNDPIKDDMAEKIKIMQDMLSKPFNQELSNSLLNSFEHTKNTQTSNSNDKINIEIEWKNIANSDELIKTLNNNKSALIIFDLHGGHNKDGEGFISLKNENITISSLIGKVRIPPIVILSACDTSPIDKNHYNVANMFLMAGAKTVLASALPILSNEASTYIARLLVRFSVFLHQHVIEYNRSIRWSSFVSGMTRQVYYTELLYKLEDFSIITKKQKYELNFAVNMFLNPLKLDFNNRILNEISKKSKKSIEEIKIFIETNHKFAECLKYIQIGNPENIIIIPNNSKLVQQNIGTQ
jgi:hypothetical protein